MKNRVAQIMLLLLLLFSLNAAVCSSANENKTTYALLDELERRVDCFNPDPQYRDDQFALVALKEAIAAAREGNYGIGACLARADGEIVQRGQNRVFMPYFRSDLHAEMDVLTRYEEQVRAQGSEVEGLVLYTSVEPCPMCLARIITSGVQKVYYLAPDLNSGMVHKLKDLPPIWLKIAEGREYAPAQCSPELKEIASEIFHYSVTALDEKLQEN